MRRLAFALVLLALMSPAAADEERAIRPGTAIRRFTRGGVEYAIYLPRAWRRRPAPLMIHMPMERFTPHRVLSVEYVQKEFEAAVKRDDFVPVHCAVLLEAHNKENAYSSRRVNVERYLTLLEKDVGVVADVVEAVSQEVPIEREAVFLLGSRYAAEAAVGIATRRPDLFTAVLAKEIETSTVAFYAGAPEQQFWRVLPEGSALTSAHRLPVVFAFDPGEPNGDKRQKTVNQLQGMLTKLGFHHVEQVPGVPDDSYRLFVSPEMYAWIAKRLALRRAQLEKAAERDELLAEGRRYADKGNLSSALTRYRKARALETEHDLDAASSDLYRTLEAQGRQMLAEGEELSIAKRKALYRKVARLFADTPLGDEAQALLE